ncbi:DNA damage-repair/toleration protein DRT100-like protein [Tanacetum coccineum]
MKLNVNIVKVILLLLTATVSLTAVNSCTPSDREALLSFKSGLTEPYIGIFNSWTGDNCCSNWAGVTCDPTDGRVNDIILRGESEALEKTGRSGYMTGSISPSLCKLDRLTTLIIADWKTISGEIPACLTTLPHLRILDLIGNQLTGSLPSDIGKLTKLTVLNVADNRLTGPVPSSIVDLSSLMHLDLSNNKLSGELPKDIGKLKMMSRALINRNGLTGTIPESISGIYRLADLDLSSNQLTGSIPDKIGSMPVLSTLNLDSNKLSGGIPVSILGNGGLNIVNLSRNGLGGYLPDVFTAGTYFSVLDLSFNKLKGAIPKSLTAARYIGHLDLSNNHLCGNIPSGFPFDHLEASSFNNNDCLCGSPLMRVDALSVIATKLDSPLMLDSYTATIYTDSWGRASYARAIIELKANVDLRDTIVVVVTKFSGEGFTTSTIRIEYDTSMWDQLIESDDHEVEFPDDVTSRYISSTRVGGLCEDDLDFYDRYEAEVYDLPEQMQTFCDQFDIRLRSRVRK